ncbi:MAG: hypothetical protein JO277_06630 [Candidatus Eremiobacteraeota bacterium]|nr:hypothetical protein [Candidatus Eremiobacteraeota bacterium]
MLPKCIGLPSTVAKILEVAGAHKSQAYAMFGRLKELLSTVVGTPGRPAAPPVSEDAVRARVLKAALVYVQAHPGSSYVHGRRSTYSDGFRRFVVRLTFEGQAAHGMSIRELSELLGVPMGTLKDWLRQPSTTVEETPCEPEVGVATDEAASEEPLSPTIRDHHIRLIMVLWEFWKGTFCDFCQMLRTEYRLTCGDTFISDVLLGTGLRQRRRQRPVEAPWSSGTFRTMFPGVQWLGDGTQFAVRWENETFFFNLELFNDPASDAAMGFEISDTEDEEAVRAAYEGGLQTSGDRPPLGVSLDNKNCNHSPGTVAAMPGVVVLRSTPGRGQAKAPLEGLFGLFQQAMPPLQILGATLREKARCVAKLVFTAWFRGRNGKPRTRLRGRTPAEEYSKYRPTQKELEAALAWLQELRRKQDAARATREARRDPVRLELLRKGLAECGIPDEDGKIAIRLAWYGTDAITYGLAVFLGMKQAGTLPLGADDRYLGGIIRNRHEFLEAQHIARHLLQQRIRQRDFTLRPLQSCKQQLESEFPTCEHPSEFVDRALMAPCAVDYQFWSEAASKALTALSHQEAVLVYQELSLLIAACFKVPKERRLDLIDHLAAAVAIVSVPP